MAAISLTTSDWKKIQREIAQLKKRVEKLEKKKVPRRSAMGKKNGANGHRKRVSKVYGASTLKTRQLRESRADDPLAKFIGAIDLGHATGADNVSIDRDLANTYADPHEPK